MYAHQVIEDLENKFLKRNVVDSLKKSIDFTIKNINNSAKFSFPEFDTIVRNSWDRFNGGVFNNTLSMFTKIPFNLCWVDFPINLTGTKVHAAGALFDGFPLKNGERSSEIFHVEIFRKLNFGWIPSIQSIIFKIGNVFSTIELDDFKSGFGFNVSTENIIIRVKSDIEDLIKSKYKWEGIGNHLDSEWEWISHTLRAIECLFLFLNCKNISTEKKYPPKSLNKKRIKQGKQPLFTYHTLVVNPMSEKKRNDGTHEPTGIKQRLHFCRGHFKEYTAEAPLFGKLTGLYWWQPMVRGNKELGIIHKDYEVRAS